jgi:dTMP kinase
MATASRSAPQAGSLAGEPRGRAWLVTLEGIDGSGKSALAARLVAELRRGGLQVVATREPTETWLGEAVRRSIRGEAEPFAEAFLFLADHAAHANRVRAWLAEGKTVVSDRWGESCLAYQAASLEPLLQSRGIDALPWLEAAQAPVHLAPDRCLLLDLAPERALGRIGDRAERVKFEQAGFLGRVRRNYLALAKAHDYIAVLDATLPPDELLARALEALRSRGLPG